MKTKKTKLTFHTCLTGRQVSHLTFYLLLTFLLVSCGTNDPPPPPPVEEEVKNTIDITEVWRDLDAMQIKFTKSSLDTVGLLSYSLLINGSETAIFFNLKSDTTYTHTGLTEGTEYRYKVEAYEENKLKDTSKTLLLSTLSPTSHNIEWTVDTLGMPGNFLNDVWGLDENNVWAVGGINLPDGDAVFIKWDGNKWNPLPIPNGGFRGLFGFSTNEIWCVGEISNRGYIAKWDGSIWSQDFGTNYFQSKGDTVYPLNAVWGSSPEEIWAVGDRGTIVHWDGVEWSKVDLGLPSELRFWDIHGSDADNIYAAGNIENVEFTLFHFNGTEWKETLKGRSGASYQSTLYCANGNLTYLFEIDNYVIRNGNPEIFAIPQQTTVMYKARGSGSNNIVTAGEFGEVFHYNGSTWSKADGISGLFSKKSLQGVYLIEDKIFIVGLEIGLGASFIKGIIK